MRFRSSISAGTDNVDHRDQVLSLFALVLAGGHAVYLAGNVHRLRARERARKPSISVC
jgi:hypothetical protein